MMIFAGFGWLFPWAHVRLSRCRDCRTFSHMALLTVWGFCVAVALHQLGVL
jgi:hypothetical protein